MQKMWPRFSWELVKEKLDKFFWYTLENIFSNADA